MKTKCLLAFTALTLAFSLQPSAFGQGTAFTYQGRMTSGASGVTGLYDFHIVLYDSLAGGNALRQQNFTAIGVTNGLFVLPLDFGGNSFKGEPLWLSLSAKTNGSAAPFVAMTPRQPLTPAPYAMFAGSADSVVNGAIGNAQLAGQSVAQFNLQVAGTPAAGRVVGTDGSGLVWTDLGALSGAWNLSGNAGTTPATQFLGTTDNQPLEMKVFGLRAFRLEPSLTGAPNVIGGAGANFAAPGVGGATIGGGGAAGLYANSVAQDFGTVSGGAQNRAAGLAASVGGGTFNTASGNNSFVGGGGDGTSSGGNTASGSLSVIVGGSANVAAGQAATVGGGYGNRATGSSATVGGGSQNYAGTNLSLVCGGSGNSATNFVATVVGGANNVAGGYGSFVGGGGVDGFAAAANVASGNAAVVGGGLGNTAGGRASFVGGGAQNTASGEYAVVPGGGLNVAAGSASFAAGLYARATNHGAFVWSDFHPLEFNSTADNQFLVRATGGVGINLNNPQAALDVAGSFRLNAGTILTNLLVGQAQMSGGSASSRTNLTITFPKPFLTPPRVVATVAADPAWDVDDTYVVSVRKVTLTSCVVNILRVDSASGWSQSLRVNWIAWE